MACNLRSARTVSCRHAAVLAAKTDLECWLMGNMLLQNDSNLPKTNGDRLSGGLTMLNFLGL